MTRESYSCVYLSTELQTIVIHVRFTNFKTLIQEEYMAEFLIADVTLKALRNYPAGALERGLQRGVIRQKWT
jgi:hypothetical protein